MPTTTTVHVIGKCPEKGCRSRRRITVNGRIRSTRTRTWTEWGIPTAAGYDINPAAFKHYDYTPSHIETYQAPVDATGMRRNFIADLKNYAAAMRSHGWVCDTHNRFMKVNAVAGVLNQDRGCDGRCEAATGHNCECSCGGTNHGAAYDAAI